ncbi:TylF/MycF/NovP-related O-methyltransferase [Arcobacter caeni]|uniref:dTDP-6-deoxy-L-hexose 3-O-methyltransferase n=1 Tax=Arcobacter caeni TaxID=1912877 RepID=A0A363CZF7_9BACT|nr:TylF/MycF/NovP-related O-methyltransferase [Arcobacter caeni]PUE64464.1 dTDP-6-deoxy-L-hexose 3-O-methyltransferase [Arcobacter caeni]
MYFQGNINKHTNVEQELFKDYSNYFESSAIPTINKLQNFTKYIRRQDLSRFLAKNEIFNMQLDIPGSIVECGTYMGGGALSFGQLSSINEPYNHNRKIIVFDTFEGFPEVSIEDKNDEIDYKSGDLSTHKDIYEELKTSIQLFDKNRPLNHIEKIELIKGDATKTIPAYIESNKHLMISLLYLDFDIYEPTKIAINNFITRMAKGSIIAFDELNTKNFPGETMAVLETIGINNLKLRKTKYDSYISYAIIGE